MTASVPDPGWLPARRAPDVGGQYLGCLIAEVAQQFARARNDPESEVPAAVLARLQLSDRGQQLIDDSLAARSYSGQRRPAVTALAHISSPAQTSRNLQEQEDSQPAATPAQRQMSASLRVHPWARR